jgi:hypothetical protein
MVKALVVVALLLGLAGCGSSLPAVQVGNHEKATWVWTKNPVRPEEPNIYRCREYSGNDIVCIRARLTQGQPGPAARGVPAAAAEPAPAVTNPELPQPR